MATELADAPTRLSVTVPDSPTTSWASPSTSRGHSRNNSTLAAELEEGQKETYERVARLSEERMRQRMADERKNLQEKLGRSPTAAAAAPDEELQARLRQQMKDKMAAQIALVSPSADAEAARVQRMKEREASLLHEMAQVRPDGAPLDVALDTAALLSDTSEAGSLRGSFDLPASGASKGTHSRKGSDMRNLGMLAEEEGAAGGGGGSGARSARAGSKSGGSTARSGVGGDEAADGVNVRGMEGGGGGDDDDGEAKKARRRRRKKKLSFSGAAGEGGDRGERVEGAEGEDDEWTSAEEEEEEEEEEEREPTVSDAVAMLPDLTWAKERMRMYNEMDGLPPEPEQQQLTEEPAVAATALVVVPGEHDEAVKRMGRLLLAEDFFAEAEKLLKENEHAGNSRLYLERKHVRDIARASFDEHIAELEVDMEQAREMLLSPTTQLAMLSPESSMAESSRPKSGKSSRPNSSRPSSAGGARGLVTFVDDDEYVDLMQESGDLNDLSTADGISASPCPERDSSSGAHDADAGARPRSGGGGSLSALIAERKTERRKDVISVKEETSSRSLGHVESSQSIGDLDDSNKSRQPSKASSRQLTPTGSPPISAHRDPLAAIAGGGTQQQQQQQHAHRWCPSPAVRSPDALRSQLNSRGGMGSVGGMGRMPRKGMPHVRPGTAPEGPGGDGGGGHRMQLGLGEPYRPITAPMLETSESSLVWESSSFDFPSVPHTPYTNAGGSVGFYPSSMLERQAARDEMRLLIGSARTYRNRHHQKRLPPSKIQQAVDRLTRRGATSAGGAGGAAQSSDDVSTRAMQELAAESSARELAELAAAEPAARSLPSLRKNGTISGRAIPKQLTDTATTRAKIAPPPEPLLSAPALWEPVIKPRTPSVRLRMSYMRDGGGYRETLSPIQPLSAVSQQQMTKRLYDDSMEAAKARAAHAERVASTRFGRPPTSARKKRQGSGKGRG